MLGQSLRLSIGNSRAGAPPARVLASFSNCVVLKAALLVGFIGIASAQAAETNIAKFIKMRWPGAAQLAPDGTLYYVFDPDGINQLYKVPAGASQEDAKKLTSFEDGIGGYSLSHDGKWIAITASVGGSEQADLFLMNADTGKMETLFSDPDVVYGGGLWRRDSKAFAYRANDESPQDFYVYIYDVENRAHKKVHSESGYFYPVDFNKDGTKLAIGKYNSATHSQLFEIDLKEEKTREITPVGEEWTFEPIGYDPNDRVFLTNTNYHADLNSVHAIDLSSGEVKPVLSDLSGREVDWGTMNEERTILAVRVNEDGYGTLHLRSTDDYQPIEGPELARGIVGNVTFTGHTMLYDLDNANTPGVIYKWNVKKPEAEPVALTKADTQGIDVSQFRLPELVHYPSFDGRKIPAFLFLPSDYKEGKRIPFLVYYHGGPESQFRPGFTRSFQYFLSRGIGVIAPNVRGSSGYGKEYIEADNYKNRMVSVKDGVAAAQYLIDEGYAKKGKIGAWGGSYGGFMVMAVITEAPALWGAACNVVGVVNFQTFLEQTKDYRRKLREVEYGPLSDPEFLKSVSPIHKIDKIEAPLMLAHGLNDPRVPIGEAMQVAVALKKRGRDVEELYFPDEGHGFAKEENRLLYYEQLAKFFEKHLLWEKSGS